MLILLTSVQHVRWPHMVREAEGLGIVQLSGRSKHLAMQDILEQFIC